MEKKKASRLFFIGSILFFIGAIVWFSVAMGVPKVDNAEGFTYGSEHSPIVMHFQADSRRDYLEISYTTTSSYVVVYQLDSCNYEAFVGGQPLYDPIILPNDQTKPMRIKANRTNCVGNQDIYLVWDIWQGFGIRVDYEYRMANFPKLTAFTICFFTGLAGFVFGFIKIVNIKEMKVQLISYRESKRRKRLLERKRRKNLTVCFGCGLDVPLSKEFCWHCGSQVSEVTHTDDEISRLIKRQKMGDTL